MAKPKRERVKGRGRGPARTSPKRVKILQRDIKALELRGQGKLLREIAEELGLASPKRASECIDRALALVPVEAAESTRAFELERLDRLLAGHWAAATGGDYYSSCIVLKIMDRRSKFLGLDAPVKTAVEHGGRMEMGVSPLLESVRKALEDGRADQLADLAATTGQRGALPGRPGEGGQPR